MIFSWPGGRLGKQSAFNHCFLPERHALIATADLSLARTLRGYGEMVESQSLAAEALQIRTEITPQDAWQVAESRTFVRQAGFSQGR